MSSESTGWSVRIISIEKWLREWRRRKWRLAAMTEGSAWTPQELAQLQAPSPASTGETNHSRNESNVSITATHIGVKLISAEPMTRLAYNQFRGWDLPANENGDDEGFLVEYLDGGKANVEGREGYISWSPADVFEKAYRPVSGLTFGLAIEALKLGKKVARAGWNGKGMWVRRIDLYSDSEFRVREVEPCTGTFMPFFVIYTPWDGKLNTWVGSISDTQAEDWQVVE